MKRNNNLLEEQKKILGNRLTEIMNLKDKSRTELRNILENEYKYPVSRQTFDKYQKGINWMPEDFIKNVSEILGIEDGYLKGNDGCSAESYQHYCDISHIMTDQQYDKYKLIFQAAGYSLGSGLDLYEKSIEYRVSSKEDSKTFSENDIEFFYQHIIDYIRSEFQKYISSDYLPENKEDWLAYYKAYPERFETDFIKENLTNDEIEQLKTEARQDKKK